MKQVLTPIVETIIRLFSKSPRYFKYLQWIITVITTLCGALTVIQDNNLFALPVWLKPFTGPDSIVLGIIALFLAKLPAINTDAVKAKVDAALNK